MGEVTALLQLAVLAGRELLLFAGIWFFVGLVDEIVVDSIWFWLRLKGRGKALTFSRRRAGISAVRPPYWSRAGTKLTSSSR